MTTISGNKATQPISGVVTANAGNNLNTSALALETGHLAAIDTATTQYATALEYDASNNPIYIGKAAQGTAKTAASWQIRKLTFDALNNVTDVQYANGSTAFNVIWNNRASLTYS